MSESKKDTCDACGEKLPVIRMKREDGLLGGKNVAVVGMAVDVMNEEMCVNYGEGSYVVCRNCVLAAFGVRPTKGHVIITQALEEEN